MSIQFTGPVVPPDGTVTAPKINSGAATVGFVLTADGAGGAAWEAPAGGGPGYLKYVALLSQAGENAPVAVVLENTLGAVAWTRFSTGIYHGTLANAFTLNKTWCAFTLIDSDYGTLFTMRGFDANIVQLQQQSGRDAVDMFQGSVEIRVYP